MKDLWGKPKKQTLKGKGGKMPDPFKNGKTINEMKTTTLSDKGGGSGKIFKSMGFK